MLKPVYLFCFLLLPVLTRAQALVTTDGPYVSYQNGNITITTIEKDDDLLMPKTKTYAMDRKAELVLDVTPEDHKEWAFKVKLKAAIETNQSVYPAANKTLFLSDIEGEFAGFRKMLLAAKVIDEQYNWIYGAGSLVVAGDLFDRGKDVVPELWLLYKLEDDAKAKRGSVQVILGNHDQMNLSGDHRYTDARYFKNAWLLKTDCTGLLGKDTELGRWLRAKNIIGKTGDVLVMHGGLSPEVRATGLTIEQINSQSRPYYDYKLKDIPPESKVFFGSKSPFWYRGYFMQPKTSMAGVDSTLKQYDCKYIVVGHTIIKWNIASYYGGKVVCTDVDEHKNHTAAVLYENRQWFVVSDRGKTRPLIYKPSNDNIKEEDIL